MQIFVAAGCCNTITLNVDRTTSVDDLVTLIENRTGLANSNAYVCFAGRVLQSGRVLADYNLQGLETVQVHPRLIGGMAKKKGKGKGKAKGADDGAEITPERKVQMLEAEKIALTRELAHYKQQARKAVSDKRDLEEKIGNVQEELTTAEDVKLQIVKDMTRQYKSMQENLLNQVNEAHETIVKLKHELAAAGQSMNASQRDFQHIIEQKDNTIRDQNRKMEDMANEFSEMLKETLEKMRQRIEVSSVTWESEKGRHAEVGK